MQGSDSDLSMAGDIRSSKSNLKGKLSGMFRRAGSSSRANSSEALDRELQRPVAIQTLGNGPTPTALAAAAGQGPPPRPVSASTPHLARVSLYCLLGQSGSSKLIPSFVHYSRPESLPPHRWLPRNGEG